jgi:DNA-binding LacI/PurR family transcriptional regulator
MRQDMSGCLSNRIPVISDLVSSPKYKQIIDELEAEISAGRFKPGSKLPSEAALVKRFDTSRITIARALRELQNAGMIDRVAGSGSFVRLREARHEGLVFGLLIPDLGEVEVLNSICQGIANAPGSDHALLWGHSTRDEESKEQRALELCAQFTRRKVSGVFFAPLEFELTADKTNRRIVLALQDADIPVVLLDRRAAQRTERTRLDMVGINNWQVGYVATEHLIKLGAKHIGFIGYHAAAATVSNRMAGYQDALREHGLPVEPMENPDLKNAGLDAFVCVNDYVAAQLMQSLLHAGATIPDEVRIVGIDDASFASLLPVPLTTVRQPCREIGEAALRTMLERIDRPRGPAREILLDGQLIIRKS